MELVQIYFEKLNKLVVITNLLAFFLLFEQFSLLDPDSGRKTNADSCGSGSTSLITGMWIRICTDKHNRRVETSRIRIQINLVLKFKFAWLFRQRGSGSAYLSTAYKAVFVTCGRGRCNDIRADPSCHVLQRGELLLVDQVELGHKVVEVFVASVHMRLRSWDTAYCTRTWIIIPSFYSTAFVADSIPASVEFVLILPNFGKDSKPTIFVWNLLTKVLY